MLIVVYEFAYIPVTPERRLAEVYQVARPAGACWGATRLEFRLTGEVPNTARSSGVLLFGLVLFA